MSGINAVFLAAAAIANIPDYDIARQQAKSVVAALELIRKRHHIARLPQIIILSSSSLEDSLMKAVPRIPYQISTKGASHIYTDLRLAEDFLRRYDWVKQVYIKPGGLVHDTPYVHNLVTYRRQDFLSFIDLTAGTVEVAGAEADKWDRKNVSVVPASPGTRIEWRVPYFLFLGLTLHFFPWTYPYFKGWLW